MRKLFINWALNAVCLYLVSLLFSGVILQSFATALIASFVLGLINTFIKPIVQIISLPITLMTLGLFTVVINAVILHLTDVLVPGFYVTGVFTTIIVAIIISIFNVGLNKKLK